MYGTLFHSSTRRPIIGQDYLSLLEKNKPDLQWDGESEESYFEFDNAGVTCEIWYPTLYSIRYDPSERA